MEGLGISERERVREAIDSDNFELLASYVSIDNIDFWIDLSIDGVGILQYAYDKGRSAICYGHLAGLICGLIDEAEESDDYAKVGRLITSNGLGRVLRAAIDRDDDAALFTLIKSIDCIDFMGNQLIEGKSALQYACECKAEVCQTHLVQLACIALTAIIGERAFECFDRLIVHNGLSLLHDTQFIESLFAACADDGELRDRVKAVLRWQLIVPEGSYTPLLAAVRLNHLEILKIFMDPAYSDIFPELADLSRRDILFGSMLN